MPDALPDLADRAARGAVAGGAATVVMSAVMAAGRATGVLSTPPPRRVTTRAARIVGRGRRHPFRSPSDLVWMGAHLAYGVALGAGYAVVVPHVPVEHRTGGVLYGIAVWAGNYMGALPALRLHPSARRDRPGRTLVMVLAHAVYGLVLAVLWRRVGDRADERPPPDWRAA